MIDHISLYVSDFEKMKSFYTVILSKLGYQLEMAFVHEGLNMAGFGSSGKPEFWIANKQPATLPTHIAFSAKNRADVDSFYAAAITEGATDNGAPGIRPIYHPNYYGAFVLDPEGHNIEAVCHHS